VILSQTYNGAFENLTSGDNKMTVKEIRELYIKVLQTGGQSGNYGRRPI
jgi:hypothetical protein